MGLWRIQPSISRNPCGGPPFCRVSGFSSLSRVVSQLPSGAGGRNSIFTAFPSAVLTMPTMMSSLAWVRFLIRTSWSNTAFRAGDVSRLQFRRGLLEILCDLVLLVTQSPSGGRPVGPVKYAASADPVWWASLEPFPSGCCRPRRRSFRVSPTIGQKAPPPQALPAVARHRAMPRSFQFTQLTLGSLGMTSSAASRASRSTSRSGLSAPGLRGFASASSISQPGASAIGRLLSRR